MKVIADYQALIANATKNINSRLVSIFQTSTIECRLLKVDQFMTDADKTSVGELNADINRLSTELQGKILAVDEIFSQARARSL